MMPPLADLSRPAYCPNCGYDLRGATGPVCSECGASVGKGISSQIPWMQRHWRGTLLAYVATAWLVLRRPSLFVDEIQWRLPARDARRFLYASILLASLVLTALLAAAFAFRGQRWLDCVPDVTHINYQTLERPQFTTWAVAAFALWDSWFVLIPFWLTTLITLWLTQWFYRRLLSLATEPPRRRRRLDRIGMYLSAIAVWESPLLGVIAITAMIQAESPPWTDDWHGTILAVQLIAGALAALLLLVPSISVIARTGTAKLGRWWCYLPMLVAAAALNAARFHDDQGFLSGIDTDWKIIAAACFVCLFVAVFLGALLTLILWKWRWQTLRIVYLIVFYPFITALIFLASAAAIFWICGYAALAVGSMLRG